jgi:hypothetical protein
MSRDARAVRSPRLRPAMRAQAGTLALLLLLVPAMPHRADISDHVAAPASDASRGASAAAPPPAPRRTAEVLASAPAAPDTTAHWWPLRTRAEAGEPLAACDLSLLIEDCALVADVADMVDTHIAMAARSGIDAGDAAREILALQASVEALQPQCASLPAEVAAQAWHYLLAAAIAGHEGSMYRFIVDPPLPREAGPAQSAALSVWHANAPLLLGSLLQRGSPEALALAFRAAQGEVFVGTRPLQAREPLAVVRLGTALVAVRTDDTSSQLVIERAADELPPALAARARSEGRALAERFLRRADIPMLARGDECREGWPGMASAYAAYGW